MGKKPKKPKAKKAAAAPEQPMRTPAQQIAPNDLKNLLRRCASLKKQGSEISGQQGEMIKNAIENKNLDRVAFAMVKRLTGMAEEKMATTLACFDYYREVLELDDAKQGALSIPRPEAGEAEEAPETETKPEGDNVHKLRAAE